MKVGYSAKVDYYYIYLSNAGIDQYWKMNLIQLFD